MPSSSNAFEARERAFEAYFAHQEDLAFSAATLRNRRLGLWAGERMGLSGGALDAYAKDVVAQSLTPRAALDPVDRVCRDLLAKGAGVAFDEVRARFDDASDQATASAA